MDLRLSDIDRLLELALAEDIGRGDWTTTATVAPGQRGTARIVAKAPCVVAGLPLLQTVWDRLSDEVEINVEVTEGERVDTGRVIAHVRGPLAALLTGERVALNLLQRLCGIATATRALVDLIAGTGATVVDTRKTLPGYRALDKYAVRVGGGRSHRSGLDSGILIKENHIAAAGSVRAAITAARRTAPITLKIEVEVSDLAAVGEALAAGADIIMLDNMALDTMKEAVELIAGRALVEASGNVTAETIRGVAETGVDVISVGALTHSVRAADISMLVEEADPR